MVDATITLYKDIGLYPDYKRSMLFDSKTQQKNWFNAINSSLRKTITANYNKLQNTFVINEDVGNVYSYTYVRLEDIDDSGRTYYGFVANVQLIDVENTEFTIAIDPIQTFMCEWSIGESLVMREHCDRWESGSSIPSRVTPNQEPVDGYMEFTVGSSPIFSNEYMLGIMAVTDTNPYIDIEGTEISKENASRIRYIAVPISASHLTNNYMKLTATFTTTSGATTKTIATLLPTYNDFISGAVAGKFGINPESVIGSWVIPVHNASIITGTAQDSDGITRSTVNIIRSPATINIIVASITEIYYTYSDTAMIVGQNADFAVQTITELDLINLFNVTKTNTVSISKPTKPTSATVTYSDIYEPALYMSPYRTRGIVSDGDNILTIPDNIALNNETTKIAISTSIGTSGIYQNIMVGSDTSMNKRQSASLAGASSRTMALASDITSNEWLSYCLTQRDSDRKAVQSSIISNTVTQLIGMGYGGALVGSRANSGRNDPMKDAAGDAAKFATRGFSKAMFSAAGIGMATGLVTSAVQGWDMWNQQLAKESGIRNQPSKLLGIGDTISDIFANNKDYWLYEGKIDTTNYNTARDNFRYYGYIVNRMETPNLKSRYYYNYICTLNTTVKGALSADIKNAIATIFEKGITFFHADHCDDTTYNGYENIERALL